jgi:hypothetical protein
MTALNKKKILYIFIILLSAVIIRCLPHPPNFSPILSFTIITLLLTNSILTSFLLSFTALIISDFFLGYYSGIFYNYLNYFFIIFFIKLLVKNNYFNFKNIFKISSISSFLFFISSNMIYWLLSPIYEKSIEGLISCYFFAIPFFPSTYFSTVIFSSILYYVYKRFYKVKI